jgi:hypothetical protein
MLHSTAPTHFSPSIDQHRRPHLKPQIVSTESTGSSNDHVAVQTPWLNGRVPNGYWDIRENRVRYLTWLGGQYGFQSPTDWYAARKTHFQKNGGGGLLRNLCQSSVLKAMCDYLPNYEWKAWMFGGAPNGFWKSASNRQRYMDWLAVVLGIRTAEDWYSVTGADFFAHHGGGLLNNEFNGSVQALLLDYKPNYRWKAWRFPSVPQGFWFNPENRRAYLRWLGEQLGFRSQNDWKRLRREHFYDNHGSGVFVGYYNGSTDKAVQELFPTTSLVTTDGVLVSMIP